MKKNYSKGISILEIIIGIALVAIITAVALTPLRDYRASVAVRTQAESIASFLSEAKTKTLSSYNASRYGVHFTSTSYTLFSGSTYDSGDSQNIVSTLSDATLSSINLTGGGSDVIFDRLLGTVSAYGTIVITSTSDATQTKTITVTKSGAISVN